MHALVTGAAGFIGSHLAGTLLDLGSTVRAVDCFTPYYDVGQKRANAEALIGRPKLDFRDVDLRITDLSSLLDGVDVVFHQAGQPGVRLSWAEHFTEYVDNNVVVTQRLLEAARVTDLERFVFASSSSVYGNAKRYPASEHDVPAPHSPYGVTKLAAEHPCGVYAANWGVPTVALRYFTVYGPRQRPDMAFHRIFESLLNGHTFELFGGGAQIRDFTFVADVVAANVAAANAIGGDVPGSVINVAGGSSVSMLEVLELASELGGMAPAVAPAAAQLGDVDRTGGSVDVAKDLIGWTPTVPLREGLVEQLEWHRTRRQ
jgi:nucleoside-diphosphate-sugar epimerase